MSSKPIVFSGVAPSGNLHIGNYIGALKHWADNQDKKENIFCVVDLHAITTFQDSKILKKNIKETIALFLAIGINPKKSTIFVQSHNSDHAALAWILNCIAPMSWLERMTQFKSKSKNQRGNISVGLFNYPSLMAADILLYETEEVPVGEDQEQHVELTRDIARRFNSQFGYTFNLPKAKIEELGARIMSLQNPEEKMSKSDKNKRAAIYLLDKPSDIRDKIKAAVTDSGGEIRFAKDKPAISNLITIFSAMTNQNVRYIEAEYQNKDYKEFKEVLAKAIIETLGPIQKKYREISSETSHLDKILKEGLSRVKPISEKTLKKVYRKVGLA